jgi:hypothetical protein
MRDFPNSPLSMPATALMALCLGLASCGGGGGADEAPAATDQTVTRIGLPSTITHPGPAAVKPGAGGHFDPSTGTSDPASNAPASAHVMTATPALVINVSTQGNDTWSGSLTAPNADRTDGPLRTIQAAQAKARARIADMVAGRLARQPIHVDIGTGTYTLSAPLSFTDADSGVAGSPVVYEAVGSVILSGGMLLSTKTSTSTTFNYAVPTGATAPTWSYGQQLYVGGRRAILARQPNDGQFYFVTKPVPLVGEPAPVGRTAYQTTANALAWVNGLPSAERSNAIVNMYQSWTTGRHHFDPNAPVGALQLTPAAKWPFMASGSNQRWYVENVRSALDAPGEFYGDSTGVTYMRRADETGSAPAAILANQDRLIAVQGNASLNRWVQYLEFRGLAFQYTRLQTPSSGLLDSQAGSLLGAAIEVDGARNLVIDNCTFTRLGSYAIWLRNDVRNSTASNNTIYDVGAGGIKVGVASQSQTDVNATAFNTISGNTITDTGHVMPGGGVGVWVGQSWDNVVTRNLISNTTYSGISVGWTWGYGAATSGRNAITNNELLNIGQGAVSDVGGIYSLGITPGTVISGNLIREVRSYGGYGPGGTYGAWGIYQDEGSSQVTIQNNVVIGTDNGGYLLHFGRNNTVSNNFFAWGDMAEIGVTVTDPLTQLAVAGNLVMPMMTKPFDRFAMPVDTTYTSNFVTTTPAFAYPDLTKCLPGCAMNGASLATTTAGKGVTLTGAPTAIATMVQQTVAGAGPAATKLPNATIVNASRPPLVIGPPLPLTVDIANAPIGSQPYGLTYSPPANLSAITIASQAGAPGNNQCLRFADSSTFINKFDPYAWATLNHATGTTQATFSLYSDSNTNFIHEWRDNATIYHIGPSFTITSAGVAVAGKVVLPITLNSWNTFHVTAALGTGAGTWSLDVTDANGVKRSVTGLATGAGWTTLNWLGFISNATVTTNACLGSLNVANQ